jgi:cytochrome c
LQGRKAGTIEGFRYSEAMRQAGENGLIWNDATLKEFLASPKTMMPGTSMRFWGLWESQIEDLLAYIKSKSEAVPSE